MEKLAALRRELRAIRRPVRELLRRIIALVAEVRSLEEATNELVVGSYYFDIPAVDELSGGRRS